MAKHIFSILLTVMTIMSGIAAVLYKSNSHVAILLWCFCGAFAVAAYIAAVYESLPKPHIVPKGYGTSGNGRVEGIIIENDGEPAYNVQQPKPTPLMGVGSSTLIFEDRPIMQLTKEDGPRCLPVTERDSLGDQLNHLRMGMALANIDSVLVSFQYADSKRPNKLRYTTICKLILTPGKIDVSFEGCHFNWRQLF